MDHHLGYGKHEVTGRGSGNGTSSKTVTTEIGQIELDVPRDRAGTFEPQIVPKRKRRLTGFDDAVISLYAKGMTTGDIVEYLEEVYDTTIRRDLVHLVRNSLRLSNRKDWQKITTGLRPIYTAPTVTAAEAEFGDFTERWQDRYPAMINTWRNAWDKVAPFLEFPPEFRKLIYTTNAIESLNARFRVATKRRGHFPDEQSALKVLYLAIRHREKNKGNNPTGQING